jgi:putative DNA primase/helicase
MVSEQRVAGQSEMRLPVLNEIRRRDAGNEKPAFDVPAAVAANFRRDGTAYRAIQQDDRVSFIDRGNRMHAYLPASANTVDAMVAIAEARGWKQMEVTGTEPFRRAAYVEATARGMAVTGYQSTEQDAEAVRHRQDRVSQDNPKVQAYLKAQTPDDRETALNHYPDLKEAFAIDAAARKIASRMTESPQVAARFIARFREKIGMALQTGHELPKLDAGDSLIAPPALKGPTR